MMSPAIPTGRAVTSAAASRFDAELESSLAELLAERGAITLWISGASMSPTLRAGDRVHVAPCRAQDLVPGDIVVLRGSPPVVHRFLYHESEGLVTKGDGAGSCDPAWGHEKVMGRVTSRVRASRSRDLARGWPWFRGRLIAAAWQLRRAVRAVV